LPWTINNKSNEYPAPAISENSIGIYDSNICEFNLYDFIKSNAEETYRIKADKTSSIPCYGNLNGTNYIGDTFTVYVGTNINIDFLIQSGFWLILFSLIPTSSIKQITNIKISIVISLLLFILHLRSEQSFYELNSKIFSVNLVDNYLVFSLLITLCGLLLIFSKLLQNRFENVLNYFPYIFLLVGTYNSLNLNFFLFCFSFFGITKILQIRKLQFGLLVTLLVSRYWQIGEISEFLFFDVDKLKGFSSSSFVPDSIIFWSLMYYFFVIGLVFLVKDNIRYIQLEKLKNNFLISGTLIFFFSALSASGPLQNFFTYYYLGLNKTASNTFNSVSGNAWRGISSTAEGIGEFYAFSLLLVFCLGVRNKKFISNPFLILLIVINLLGLYRSNNFAAISTLFILSGFIYTHYNIKTFKIKMLLILLVIVIIPFAYYSLSTIPSLDDLSRNLIKESFEVSYLENLQTNQFGQTAIQENRFLEILQNEGGLDNISSSLEYLVEKYHYSDRDNLPNLTTVISSLAYPINRSEKWGIFIAKYDPDINSFLFGTGVNQLSNYYLNHPTKVNTGLILPHSALLSYLVYFGLFGVLLIVNLFIYLYIVNKSNTLYLVFMTFFLLNIIKSDSLLYINNFMLFIFILNIPNLFQTNRENLNSEEVRKYE
jgi:hypothetical protein